MLDYTALEEVLHSQGVQVLLLFLVMVTPNPPVLLLVLVMILSSCAASSPLGGLPTLSMHSYAIYILLLYGFGWSHAVPMT